MGYFYSNVTNDCVASCPPGYQVARNVSYLVQNINATGDQCIPCPTGCASCVNNICLICNQGLLFNRGQCQSNCPSNYYQDSNNCIKCSDNCLTCSDFNTCLSCLSTFLLSNGTCNILCINSLTTVASSTSNVCSSTCDASCLYCAGPLNNSCTACPTSSKFYAYTCIPTCPSNTY
jgi:proprotein convertase subtilisin/kexin type 5